jgi:RecB family exonuclease
VPDPRAELEGLLLEDERLEATYVFPSEVVRAHWAERYLAISGRAAARSDRFMAWDRFRDSYLLNPPEGRAADDIDRLLYASDLLSRNAEAARAGSPLLFEGPRPEFAQAAGAHLQTIKAILPALGRLEDAPAEGTRLRDLRFIKADYQGFLESRKLYEKAWLRPVWKGEGRFVLYFCDLATDWDDMRGALDGIGFVRIIASPSLDARPPLRLFNSEAEEIAWALAEIAEALRSGTAHRDIAVSLGGADRMLPRLKREARLRGVELDIREGKPLAGYPAGRFFRNYARCASGSMELEALRDLLAPGLYPWRRAADIEGLARFGAERRLLTNFKGADGERIDVWEDALKRFGAPGGLTSCYREMKRDFAAFRACASLQELQAFYARILSARMDRASWDADADAVVARCAMELDALAAREAELGLSIRDPSSVFLARLESTRYLADRPDKGVPVYRYRVAAGINPKLHLALGLSLERATVRSSPDAAALDEGTRLLLGLECGDMSARYAAAYAVSGADVRASASLSTSEGRTMAHPAFDAIEAGPMAIDPLSDPFAAEDAFYCGRGAVAATSPAIRVSALAYAARKERGLDLRYGLPVMAAPEHPDDRASVSPTPLDEFTFCPFFWYLRRRLLLEPKEDISELAPTKTDGTFLHKATAAMLRACRDARKSFGAFGADESRAIIEAAVDASLAEVLEKQGAVAAAAWRARRGSAIEALSRLWAWLAGEKPDHSPAAIEAELSEGDEPELTGRIDAILVGMDSTLLIDFKRGETPNIKNHRVGGDGRVEKSQMAIYALLAQAAGMEADECAYWSFSKAEPTIIRGGSSSLTEDEFKASIDAVRSQARGMAARIGAGDFRIDARPSCLEHECDMAPVCRRPYLSEEPHAAP